MHISFLPNAIITIRARVTQDEEGFLDYLAMRNITGHKFLATFTSGNGLRWDLFCSLLSYFIATGLPYVAFTTDRATQAKCEALGANCFFPSHTLTTVDLTPGVRP